LALPYELYFFSTRNNETKARSKGNIDVIMNTKIYEWFIILYRLSSKSRSSPLKYAVKNVPNDLIPKKKVTLEDAELS